MSHPLTDQHSILPTKQQLADWDSEYYDESQNFDVMMIKAFQAGADWKLKQVVEWLQASLWLCDDDKVIKDLKAAMRPQEES